MAKLPGQVRSTGLVGYTGVTLGTAGWIRGPVVPVSVDLITGTHTYQNKNAASLAAIITGICSKQPVLFDMHMR